MSAIVLHDRPADAEHVVASCDRAVVGHGRSFGLEWAPLTKVQPPPCPTRANRHSTHERQPGVTLMMCAHTTTASVAWAVLARNFR